MQTGVGKSAKHKMITGKDGNRYQFFCDLSGALICTSEPVLLDTPEQELRFAWENEGKKCFNLCHNCGKWVSDVAYNADTLTCIACSPWEDIPEYCPYCGEKADQADIFCSNCKNRLRYGF